MQPETQKVDIESLMKTLFDRIDARSDESDGSVAAMQAILLNEADLIREIAAACEKTGIYTKSKARSAEFKAGLEASTEPADRLMKSWGWLLDRITEAPTAMHRIGSVRLCMPLVAAYLPSDTDPTHVTH